MELKIATCPHCGSVLNSALFRTRLRQRIYEYVLRHPGCNWREIADYVYALDPHGGPDTNSISVLIYKMNKELQKLGIRIKTRRGPGASYQVIKLKENHDASI